MYIFNKIGWRQYQKKLSEWFMNSCLILKKVLFPYPYTKVLQDLVPPTFPGLFLPLLHLCILLPSMTAQCFPVIAFPGTSFPQSC